MFSLNDPGLSAAPIKNISTSSLYQLFIHKTGRILKFMLAKTLAQTPDKHYDGQIKSDKTKQGLTV